MTNRTNQSLMEVLNKCASECSNCATACLEEPEVKMLTKCIKLDIDCADICRLTSTLLARNSEHGKHLLKECIEICKACAEECEKHGKMGMEHCKQCSMACMACAEACEAA